MRPVNRGQPTDYTPVRQPVLFGRAQAAITALDDLHEMQAEADQLWADVNARLTARHLTLKKRKAGPPAGDTITKIFDTLDKLHTNLLVLLGAPGSTDGEILAAASDFYSVASNLDNALATARAEQQKKIGTVYPRARGELITNIGQYCSYCEMPLAASLAVEHMLPKAEFWGQSVTWSNFLLACPICNSIKNSRPTRAQGLAEAVRQGWTQDDAHIQAGALALYLWPSDAARYTRFQDFYSYSLWAVFRTVKGTVLKEAEIRRLDRFLEDQRLRAVSPGEQALFGLARNGQVWATIEPFLARIETNADGVAAWLNAPTATPPAELAAALAAIVPNDELLTDPTGYQTDLSGAPAVTPLPGDNAWLLSEVQFYPLHTVQDRLKPQEIAWLRSGLVPDRLATSWGINPFCWRLSLTEPGLSEFDVLLTRSYKIVNRYNGLHIYAQTLYPVELRLNGATPEAAYTVSELELNKVVMKAPEAANRDADRRAALRARAFFWAVDAYDMLRIADARQLEGLLADVQNLVIENAVSSGFWSVWRSVLARLISNNKGWKADFLARLAAAFPGTRR